MQETFKKIIEKLEKCKDIMISSKVSDCFEEECKYNDCTVCAFAKAIEIVKQEAEQYNNGWILCSEQLPEEDTIVIACFFNGVVTELAFHNGIFHGTYDYTEKMIIAWQPLPQPYQPKGE